ncbi:hypothetical protein QJQ45_027166 [Haematococcus lacustris]|nr:hypothetical protein QJQ45_027166 [Haematococcus lacustris]
MAKKKRKGSDKKQRVSRSAQGKQRQDRRDGWTTRRRQVTAPPYESPHSKRSKPAAEPTKGKGKGKAAKAKPAPQPGRWLDRDCNAALNMQRIGESRWRPLELRYWPDQGALPAKGKEYPGLGYKRLRDKPPKAQEQEQQPAEAQSLPHVSMQVAAASVQQGEALPSQGLDELNKPQHQVSTDQTLHITGCYVERIPKLTDMPVDFGLWVTDHSTSVIALGGGLVALAIVVVGISLCCAASRKPVPSEAAGPEGPGKVPCHSDIPGHQEANTHRRLLGMKKQGSLQDTLPLPCRMRHAVHVCQWLERWQQPPTPPAPGQPKRGKRRGVGPRTLTCPPPFTLTPMARVGVHFIKVDSRVLHGVCRQLGLTKETRATFTSEPALSHHWARWFNTNKLRNKEFHFERLVDTDGVSVCVHYTQPLPPPPAPPPPAASSSSTSSRPSAAAAAAHAMGLPHIGRGIAEMREFVFDPDTQIGVGIDPGVTQAVSAASGVWDPATGQLKADQLRRWKLTRGEVKHASGLNNARRDTERWLAPIKPHLQHLAAASSAGTSLEANLKHITVTLATWDAVWEVYLDPKWARQRLRLYGAQDRALEQFFNKLEEDMTELSMQRHGHAKQLVVFFGAATIGTGGGWGADAVLRACRKVVCRPRGTDQLRGRVVLVDEHRTTRVSSAVNGKQPCEVELNTLSATRPAGWKPPAGQVEQRLLRPAWSQQRDQPVIKVPEGAVLRGCKKTRRKLREHLRLRAEIHSQLRVIASLFVLRSFLTCLVGYPSPGFPSAPQPPAVQPPNPLMHPPYPHYPHGPLPSLPLPSLPAWSVTMTLTPSQIVALSQSHSLTRSQSQNLSQSRNPPKGAAAPAWQPLHPQHPLALPCPVDCEDPAMLRQLKDFCQFFANPNFKTCYNQLQRRLVRHRHPMLMPAFEDPSNQALLAKLQELCSIKLSAFHNTMDAHSMQLARIVKLYAKAARAQLGWSGEEAQLFIRMACGYGINAKSSELKAATLDKGHVADLVEEANTHRRLLGMKKQGSLQDTLPLPCRMRHAVHVCQWLERWQQPPTPPAPGQPKRGKRRGVGPRTLTCPPPFTLTPMARVGVHFIKVDSRVLHGVCRQLGLTKETRATFTSEPALSHHWARWFNTNKLRNKEFHFERLVDTDGVSVCVHYTQPLPPPPAPPPPAASSSSTSSRPSAAAAAAHAVGLPHIGRGIAEMREFVFDPDTQIGVGIDPGVTQAVSAASGVWDPATGQLKADQLRRWKLTRGEVKHASGLNNARRDTERWLAPIKPHLQHLAAASSAGTSLEANLKHITVTLATWDAVWEVYVDPKWARQRLRLYGAQDRALEQFFNKLEEDMTELSMQRHGHAKQLVVFFGAATIGTGGGWGADAVLRACRKVVCRPRGTDQLRGRVVLVDEHRTTRVSSAVNGKQPCEVELNTLSATRPAGWKPPAGQVEQRLLRPAWSQQRDQPVRGLMWCPVVAPRKPPQAPRSSQEATPTAALEPGPSTPQPAKRSKRTKAEPAAEPTKGKGKGKAAKAKPAPQPGRWLDRDCNAALNMQRIGESRWRPLELCYWPEQGALPAKGKEYPGLGYKRLRDKPPKAQQQQQQPAEAQ